MERSINIKTRKLIELSEISLSGAKRIYSNRRDKLFSWEFDVRQPMRYMLIGMKDFFLPYGKAILLFLVLLLSILLFDFLFFNTSIEVKFSVFMMFLIIIPFALPSRYAYYGTSKDSIDKVISILYNLKIKNKYELELIEKNIESIYIRVQDRIKVLRWVVSASWIAYVFITKQISFLFDKLKIEDIDILMKILEENISIIMYFLLPIILISVYKRGTSFLFQSILFGLNDYKINIQNKTNKPLENTFLKLNK